MTTREQYDRAMTVIGSRKQRAIIDAQRRRMKAMKAIPKIAELEQKMSQASIRLSKLILSKQANVADTIPEIMRENLQMQTQIKSLLVEHGFSENFLQEEHTCKKCQDTGFIEGVRCSCLESLMQKMAIEEFNQSTTMSLCTFDDFKLDYYNTKNKNTNGASDYEIMSLISQFCREYADSFNIQSASILMIGKTGLGKTHLSLSIANEIIKKGYSVLYGSAQEFFTQIQNEHFGKNKDGEDTMKTILNSDLFILDDLGSEYESSFNVATLYNIINSRLNRGKPTIVNTNLTMKEMETRYTQRVTSRLTTIYKCLLFVGTDIRQLKLRER